MALEIDLGYSVAPKLGAGPRSLAISAELQRELADAGKIATESEFELADTEIALHMYIYKSQLALTSSLN